MLSCLIASTQPKKNYYKSTPVSSEIRSVVDVSVGAVSALVFVGLLFGGGGGGWLGAAGKLNGSYCFKTLFTNFAKYMQIVVVIISLEQKAL